MSRKARLPICLPQGTEAKVVGKTVTVKGPKGTLERELLDGICVTVKEKEIFVSQEAGKYKTTNFLGLFWALINNMVVGVHGGFKKQLEMIGVGFRAVVQGKVLDLQVGYSHPTKLSIPDGLTVSVEKNTFITVQGIDKQQVGQFAAEIRSKRPPEPYKGKGVRYVDEYVRRKAGKAGKK